MGPVWNRAIVCAAVLGWMAGGVRLAAGAPGAPLAASAGAGAEGRADQGFDDPKLFREIGRAPAVGGPTPTPTPTPTRSTVTPPTKSPTATPAPAKAPAAPVATTAVRAATAGTVATAGASTGATTTTNAAAKGGPASGSSRPVPSTTPERVARETEPGPPPPPRPPAPPPQSASSKSVAVVAAAAVSHDAAPPKAEPSLPAAGIAAKASPPETAAPAASNTPATAPGAWPYVPRMKLSYRRFPFTRLGAASTTTPPTLGPGSPQSFESVSLDFYPISWYLRVGLSTQFGWEAGQFDRSGDYFFAESASVGFQIPGRFTPFAEALAGGGYMRRIQTDASVPTAYWQLGVDAGVEIYFANRAYGSIAVGYLHPANLFLMQQTLMSVKVDTWSLKIGLGI